MPSVRRVLVVVLLVAGALPARASPDRAQALQAEFEGRKRKVLVEAAQEHLKVGVWCRDAGLVAQATAEFLRAVEVAEGRHPGALKVLAIMRNLEDRFWKKTLEDPSPGMIRAYDKRARKARRAYEAARLDLAAWAAKKRELAEPALQEYKALLADLGGALVFDDQGRIVLESGTIPAELSQRLKSESVTINDRTYVRDALLGNLPEIQGVSEAESEALRIRCPGSPEQAARLLAACEALLPKVAADAGGEPTRRLDVFVFPTRATYEKWLDAVGLGEHKVGTGLADGGRHTALVCGEGLDDGALLGVVFHELAHLVQYEVVPVVMPSWYAEGFAETWGGTGTYAWDGTTLEAGGPMAACRIDPLRAEGGFLPLEELLRGDALHLLTTDRGRGLLFYAESWALLRFLRTAAEGGLRARFRQWELLCKGAALGAVPGKPYGRDTAPASQQFRSMFEADLPAIETAFRAWLATQGGG